MIPARLSCQHKTCNDKASFLTQLKRIISFQGPYKLYPLMLNEHFMFERKGIVNAAKQLLAPVIGLLINGAQPSDNQTCLLVSRINKLLQILLCIGLGIDLDGTQFSCFIRLHTTGICQRQMLQGLGGHVLHGGKLSLG